MSLVRIGEKIIKNMKLESANYAEVIEILKLNKLKIKE